MTDADHQSGKREKTKTALRMAGADGHTARMSARTEEKGKEQTATDNIRTGGNGRKTAPRIKALSSATTISVLCGQKRNKVSIADKV